MVGDRYQFRASDLRYGVCVGGPTDGKMLAHHEPTYRLAISVMHPGRSYPGMQASTDPDIKFGVYYWHGRVWMWEKKPEGERMTVTGDGRLL